MQKKKKEPYLPILKRENENAFLSAAATMATLPLLSFFSKKVVYFVLKKKREKKGIISISR